MPRRKGGPKRRDRQAEHDAAWAAWQRVKADRTLEDSFLSYEELLGSAEYPAQKKRSPQPSDHQAAPHRTTRFDK